MPPALLLAALLAGCSARASHGATAPTFRWKVVSGQPFVDAVEAWGASNTDANYTLDAWAIVDLGQASWPDAAGANPTGKLATSNTTASRPPFSSGTLTIKGQRSFDNVSSSNTTSSSVINTAMRSGLTPPLVLAHVDAQDLSWVNLCINEFSMAGMPLFRTSSLMGLWGMNLVVQALRSCRTVRYIDVANFNFLAYIVTASVSPWPAIQERYSSQLSAHVGLLQQNEFEMLAHEILTWQRAPAPGRPRGSSIYRSIAKPNDPLLDFMRQEGLLMAPRWCGNGSLVPAEIAESPIDAFYGPFYTAETLSEAAAALRNATALAAAQQATQLPIPAVMLFTPALALTEAALPPLNLTAPLQLLGPANSRPAQPGLDLTARQRPLFAIGGDGLIYVRHMTLHVPALPPPGASNTTGTPLPASALPLFALAAPWPAPPQQPPGGVAPTPAHLVELHNVTLVVPLLDFLALLVLAVERDGTLCASSLRPMLDDATLRHADALAPGVRAAQLRNGTAGSFLLASYSGWGVNATLLTVQSVAPLPDCLAEASSGLFGPNRTAVRGRGPTAGNALGSETARVGVVVGCSVAGAVVVAALAAAAALLLRRRSAAARRRSALLKGDVESLGASPSKPSGADELPARTSSTSSNMTSAARSTRAAAATTATAHADACGTVEERPGDDVVALLQGRERQLLHDAASTPPPDVVVPDGATTGVAAAATTAEQVAHTPASLMDVHAQLMSLVAAQRLQHRSQERGQGREEGPAEEAQVERRDAGSAEAVAGGGGGSHEAGSGAGGEAAAAAGQGAARAPRRSLLLQGLMQDVRQAAGRLKVHRNDADTVVLEGVLGQGSGGIVYAGRWRGLPVAVKTLVFEAWEGGDGGGGGEDELAAPSAHLRFVRAVMETAISASVGHPNVVATYSYDVKRMDDQLETQLAPPGQQAPPALGFTRQSMSQALRPFKVFLVQELCISPLRTLLQSGALHRKPNWTAIASSLLHQVASGLEYLHGLGVIHGDLTPGNVLLKLDPSRPEGITSKLADFGLSTRLDAQATHVSGFGAGTPFYVAPEVVALRRTSPASDVYSFGVVAWEMLTTLPPHVTLADGSTRHHPLFPSFPPELPLPPELEQLITRCLSEDPHARPSASHVALTLFRHTAS